MIVIELSVMRSHVGVIDARHMIRYACSMLLGGSILLSRRRGRVQIIGKILEMNYSDSDIFFCCVVTF